MICIKAAIPKALCEIDDEQKAIYHSKDSVCIWVLYQTAFKIILFFCFFFLFSALELLAIAMAIPAFSVLIKEKIIQNLFRYFKSGLVLESRAERNKFMDETQGMAKGDRAKHFNEFYS